MLSLLHYVTVTCLPALLAQILFFPRSSARRLTNMRGKSNLPAKFILVFGGLPSGLAGRLTGGLAGGFGSDRLTVAVNLSKKLKKTTGLLVFCFADRLHKPTGSCFIFLITWIPFIKPKCIGRCTNHFTCPARRTRICPGCLTGRHDGEEWSKENGFEDHGLKFCVFEVLGMLNAILGWEGLLFCCFVRLRSSFLKDLFTGKGDKNIRCVQASARTRDRVRFQLTLETQMNWLNFRVRGYVGIGWTKEAAANVWVI